MVYIFGPLFFTIIVNWLKVNFSKNLVGGGCSAPPPPPPPWFLRACITFNYSYRVFHK